MSQMGQAPTSNCPASGANSTLMSAFAGCGHCTCIGGGIGFLARFERIVRSLLPASETAEKRSYEQFDHRRTSHAILLGLDGCRPHDRPPLLDFGLMVRREPLRRQLFTREKVLRMRHSEHACLSGRCSACTHQVQPEQPGQRRCCRLRP
jgi:hypothetical protein